MAWVRSISIAVGALVVVAIGGWGCSGGEGGVQVDLSDPEQVVTGALEALSPAGRVVHLSGNVQEDGEERAIEIWIDADNERGRRETIHMGERREVSVINGWEVTSYDPWGNRVDTQSMRDWPLPQDFADNPVLLSVWYVWMISSADELAIVGREKVGGHDAVVVNMTRVRREPLGDQEPGTDKVTLVLNENSLLPVGEEWMFVSTAGEESPMATVSYEQAEYLSPGDLPSGFFSPQSLDELVIPE